MSGLTRHGKQFCSSSPSSSFSPFDYVDEDTLVEIISRLPIKCMVRSTCVCKQWHRLISLVCVPRIKSSPPHALLFSLCTSSPSPKPGKGPMTLAWTNSPDQDFTSLNDLCNKLPFTPSPKDFLDCCNGVFLFFCQLTREFFLCNPTTEQCLPIPNSPQNDIPDFAALFFDPHAKICYISKLFPLTVNLFSIQTRQWSVHKFLVRPPSAANKLIARLVFVNGFLYCLSFDAYLLGINIKKQMRVHTLNLPEVVTAKKHPVGCIGVSQGRLHYAWGNREYYVMVWMLGKGGISDGWVLKYTISRQYFVQHPLSRNSNFCLVHAFDPTSNAFFVCTARNLFRYDPDNKKLETVCRIKKGTYICAGQYLVYPFSPSLTTLDAPSQSINN